MQLFKVSFYLQWDTLQSTIDFIFWAEISRNIWALKYNFGFRNMLRNMLNWCYLSGP